MALHSGAGRGPGHLNLLPQGSASGSSEFPVIAGSYNFTKANNAKILAAMTATKANTADTIIAHQFDSTGFGQNSSGTETTNAKVHSTSQQLSDLLQTAGIPSSCDSWFGSGEAGTPSASWANLLLADPKLTATGTGFALSSFPCVGGHCFTSSDTTSTFTYTTAKSCNKVDVYYLGFSSGGDFVFSVDGGAESAAQHTAQAVRSMYKVTLDLGTHATHAVKFRITTAPTTNVFLIGFRFYDTNTRRVIVDNQGACGWDSTTWLNTANGESPGNQFANTGAHLSIAEIGAINDRSESPDPTTYVANLQTFITGLHAANADIWAFNPEPVSDSTTVSFAYQAAILAKANAASITMLDIMSTYTQVTPWVAAGFGDGTDLIHPNQAGYGYIAAREAALVEAVWAAA
jgi:hypothetical protein